MRKHSTGELVKPIAQAMPDHGGTLTVVATDMAADGIAGIY